MHGDPPKFFIGKTQTFSTLFLVSVNVCSMVFVAQNGRGPAGEAPSDLCYDSDRSLSTKEVRTPKAKPNWGKILCEPGKGTADFVFCKIL